MCPSPSPALDTVTERGWAADCGGEWVFASSLSAVITAPAEAVEAAEEEVMANDEARGLNGVDLTDSLVVAVGMGLPVPEPGREEAGSAGRE